MAHKAVGKKAFGFSDRSGFRYPLKDLVPQIINGRDSGLRVGKNELDKDQPQLQLGSVNSAEGISLQNPRPDKSLAESREVYLPRISVSGKNLIRSGTPFKVWGWQPLNNDWWEEYYTSTTAEYQNEMLEWFSGNRRMGANVARFHLQLWTFISGSSVNDLTVNTLVMENFIRQLDMSRQNSMYALVCGANVWTPSDAPAWYDALTYMERWNVQEFFWSKVASAVVAAGHQTTILGYDLINEPVTRSDPDADWYNGEFGGYYFVPTIARGPEVNGDTVRAWIIQLRDAIKIHDPQGLITIGSLNLASGGVLGVENTQDLLDFLEPHGYPPEGTQNIPAWTAGTTPVVWGETLPWSFIPAENAELMEGITGRTQGAISFSYGYPPEDFTFPVHRPPAQEVAEPGQDEFQFQIAYAIQQLGLTTFLLYRDAFLADQDVGLNP